MNKRKTERFEMLPRIDSKRFKTSYNKRLEFAAEAGLWSKSSHHVQEPKLRAS